MEMHPLSSVLSTSIEKIREMVDGNTIIGDPITAPNGTIVIPVSKISFGFVSGGSDFSGKNVQKTNFGGGSGGGMTVTPVGFLVVGEDGVRLIPIGASGEPVDKLVSAIPDLFDKLTGLFKKVKKDKQEKKAEAKTAAAAEAPASSDAAADKTAE